MINMHHAGSETGTTALFSRRAFLASAACATAGAWPCIARAIDPFPRTRPSHLKLSLAAYSYKPYLTGEKSPKMDLFQFVDLALLLQDHPPELFDFRTRGWCVGGCLRT